MARPLTVKKYTHKLPYLNWQPNHNCRLVYHGIEHQGEVNTIKGPMIKVQLTQRAEFINPTTDVAALLGKVPRESLFGSSQSELWFWNDKYWVKALDGYGGEWYKNRCFLFYEVQVSVTDEFMEEQAAERANAQFNV